MPDESIAQSEAGAKIEAQCRMMMSSMNVPAASLAVVKGANIYQVSALGLANVERGIRASTHMRFPIGSISKQFTAAAVLLLAEQGKLSIDDAVSKFLPEIANSKKITIRELLAQTSGYQDYWPQNYVPVEMRSNVDPYDIAKRWTNRALTFAPGTAWQYSSTNFLLAGLIVEKVSGQPLFLSGDGQTIPVRDGVKVGHL
jgi:D-alanyl-D-alanine carboxypeptidase